MTRIAIIGTGPAGLGAACVLSQAGFEVTMFEKSNTIGGKVTSYDDKNKSYEHGIHGWWNNYKNFEKLLLNYNIDPKQIFKEVLGSTMILPDGKRFSMQTLSSNLPSPFFLAQQMVRAQFLTRKDFLSFIKFGLILFAFIHERDYEKYDKLSFMDLLNECNVSDNLKELIFKPFILSFDFTTPDRVSAACGLSGMHFYVIRDQQSICTRWLKATPCELIFDPILKILQEKGILLNKSSKVVKINFDNSCNHIKSLILSSDKVKGGVSSILAEIEFENIPNDKFIPIDGSTIMIGKFNNEILSFDSTCSHNGCSVKWNESASAFECPCHGGKYNAMGEVVTGPPPHSLKRFGNEVVNGKVLVKGFSNEETIEFDEIIISADLINSKELLQKSLPPTHIINQNFSKLDTTPVFVVRLWFKGLNYEPDIDSALTPKFKFIDNYFNLNSFSNQYDTQGHLIEVQSYRVFDRLQADDAEIVDIVLSELSIINKKYCKENLLSFSINRHKQLFTRYAPSLNKYRPGENSGIDGLYFSGDWTSFNYPIWMMERALVSGMRAANQICKKHGKKQYEILVLDKGSISFQISKILARIVLKINVSGFSFITLFEKVKFYILYYKNKIFKISTLEKNSEGLYYKKPENYTWRDWTVFLLRQASEIEHSLMVQYLFCAYSINPVFGSAEFETLLNWKKIISEIAVEEMGHLFTVQNVLKLLRGSTTMERNSYPYSTSYYPFPFELERFSKHSIAKYVVAEMPCTELTNELNDIVKDSMVDLKKRNINNVGLLYHDIIFILEDKAKIPDDALSVLVSEQKVSDYWKIRKNIISSNISNRTEALNALKEIAEQGEGMDDVIDSHFEKFLTIYREVDLIDRERISFMSVNTVNNPTLVQVSNDSNFITDNLSRTWAELFNNRYRATLSLFSHLLNINGSSNLNYKTNAEKELLELIHREMNGKDSIGGLKSMAEKIFTLPLKVNDKFGMKAGPTFELPFSLSIPNNEVDRWQFHKELSIKSLEYISSILAVTWKDNLAIRIKENCEQLNSICDRQSIEHNL